MSREWLHRRKQLNQREVNQLIEAVNRQNLVKVVAEEDKIKNQMLGFLKNKFSAGQAQKPGKKVNPFDKDELIPTSF